MSEWGSEWVSFIIAFTSTWVFPTYRSFSLVLHFKIRIFPLAVARDDLYNVIFVLHKATPAVPLFQCIVRKYLPTDLLQIKFVRSFLLVRKKHQVARRCPGPWEIKHSERSNYNVMLCGLTRCGQYSLSFSLARTTTGQAGQSRRHLWICGEAAWSQVQQKTHEAPLHSSPNTSDTIAQPSNWCWVWTLSPTR